MTVLYSIGAALAAVAIVLGVLPILLTLRFRRYVDVRLRRPLTGYAPKVSIILPCKGVDPGFEANLQAIFDQDYPDFEVIFATAAAEDEACPSIRRVIAENPEVPARLVHAGLPVTCSQKLNNQLHAIAEIRPDTAVIVFLDSDGRLDRSFLRRLVDPLGSDDVGVTTGYRWYSPVRGGAGSWVRTTWNGGAYPFLVMSGTAFAWSGAMAIRRELFDNAGVARRWQRAITDEFTLTAAVKEAGKTICFVPSCIAVSHEDSTLRETIEWTNRQTLLMRVYQPRSWWSIFIGYALGNLLALVGVAVVVVSLRGPASVDNVYLAMGVAMLLPVLLGPVNVALMLPAICRMTPPDVARGIVRSWTRFCAACPAASLLILANSVHSSLTNCMTWRGVRYQLRSPTNIAILSPRAGG